MLKAYFRFKTFITVLRHISNLKVKYTDTFFFWRVWGGGGGGGGDF